MIDYSEDWLITLLFQVRGSVALRASLFAIPCAIMAGVLVYMDDWYPNLREDLDLLVLDKSQLWSATTAMLGILLSFRTNRAMARFWEGTGLLHQMRGEWFDSISCCVTFSVGAAASKKEEVLRFRHTIVRLMSLCHGSALEEIAGDTAEAVETIDSLGLDNATLAHLKSCKEKHSFNRVEVLLHLTQSIITKSLDDGILKIPPPILSRVYQTLSRGFVNLLNAKKIADTRFPFPYAQLIAILLFGHTILTPVMLSTWVKSKVWAPIFTFVPIFAFFSINFIGVELENPFGADENDLPLEHFQDEMNKCLMMLLHEGADLIAGVSESRCIFDFPTLAKSMTYTDTDSEHHAAVQRVSVSDFANVVDVHADDKLDNKMDKSNIQSSASSSPMNSSASQKNSKKRATGSENRGSRAGSDNRRGTAAIAQIPEEPVEEIAQAAAAPSTPKAEPKMRQQDLDTDLSSSNLQGLRKLVETQVQELSRSIAALTQFSDSLPGVLDTMLIGHTSAGTGPSLWRKDLERVEYAASNGTSPQLPARPCTPSQRPDGEQYAQRGFYVHSNHQAQPIHVIQVDAMNDEIDGVSVTETNRF